MMGRLARASRPVLAIAVVVGLAHLHGSYLAEVRYPVFANPRFPWVSGFALVMVLVGYALGLPEEPRSRLGVLVRSAGVSGAALAAISGAQLLLGQPLMPRFVALGAPLLLLPVDLLVWNLCGDASARTSTRTRAIVVALEPEAVQLQTELLGEPERPAVVAAVMQPVECRPRRPEHRPLVETAREAGVNLVVLDRHAQADDSIVQQAAELHADGVSVRTLSMFYSEHLGKVPVSELERISLLFDVGEVHRGAYPRCKRALDLVVASLGLFVLVPLVPVVWLVNRVANPGPLWFRQQRVGRGGRPLTLLKFRTMRETGAHDSRPGEGSGADGADGADVANPWTMPEDSRITPFGGWLRRTHLDELPQLLGVLRGELTLVGPRPEQPEYVARLRQKLPFYEVRLLVRPGLTGWAQLKYGYASDTEDAREKLQHDIYYLQHQSLVFDLRILGRTLRHVFAGGGR